MNKISSFSYFLRKSPVVRTGGWICAALLFVIVSVIFGMRIQQKPEIESIVPPVGSPGDLIIITGRDFGAVRDTSYVEFGGSRLTSSSYISWTDTEIKVILPPNIQDGLVFVGVQNVRSKPAFFANATTAPVAVTASVQTTLPIITGISPEKLSPGVLMTISGSNFGNSRDKSKVYFSSNREKMQAEEGAADDTFEFICADENDFDYQYWSDSEIRVYVPDGASDGVVFVQTSRGKSAQRTVAVDNKAGAKSFITPKTYVIQVSADIEDNSSDRDSSIILRVPRPFESAAQPSATLIESSPEPIIPDFQHTVIHQAQGGKYAAGKRRFTQNFAVTVYETRTNVVAARLNSISSVNKELYSAATSADEIVPSANEEIRALLSSVIGKERNPYNIAVLVYNYMIQNFEILNTVRTGRVSPLDMLDSKKGDAYDFAVVFTALMRAAGIPSYTDSGVLVGVDLRAKNHWWCELYLPGFGWFPVDPALGAGMEYQGWKKDVDAATFYFGNLDGQHILFSRGLNEIKSSSPNSKTVQKSRSFALQSVWEEASGKSIKYSSYWADPSVIGVY